MLTLARVLPPRWCEAPDPDGALLAAAKRGDQRAFDRLRGIHETQLHRFVIRRVGADAAEDVIQETWLSCWQALSKYAGRSRFKAWLYGIAAHKCADCIERRGRETRKQEAIRLEPLEAPDAYHAVELRHVVQEALCQLPNEQREVLELYYDAELTLAEIAHTLHRNLNTVKYQFYRGHTCIEQRLPKTIPAILGRE